jgi:hypothetical protein
MARSAQEQIQNNAEIKEIGKPYKRGVCNDKIAVVSWNGDVKFKRELGRLKKNNRKYGADVKYIT